jgi:hypothetical protein
LPKQQKRQEPVEEENSFLDEIGEVTVGAAGALFDVLTGAAFDGPEPRKGKANVERDDDTEEDDETDDDDTRDETPARKAPKKRPAASNNNSGPVFRFEHIFSGPPTRRKPGRPPSPATAKKTDEGTGDDGGDDTAE